MLEFFDRLAASAERLDPQQGMSRRSVLRGTAEVTGAAGLVMAASQIGNTQDPYGRGPYGRPPRDHSRRRVDPADAYHFERYRHIPPSVRRPTPDMLERERAAGLYGPEYYRDITWRYAVEHWDHEAAAENILYPYILPGHRIMAWDLDGAGGGLSEKKGAWRFKAALDLTKPENRRYGVWPDSRRDDFIKVIVFKDGDPDTEEEVWMQDPRPDRPAPPKWGRPIRHHGAYNAPINNFYNIYNDNKKIIINNDNRTYSTPCRVVPTNPCGNRIYGGYGGCGNFYRMQQWGWNHPGGVGRGFGRGGFGAFNSGFRTNPVTTRTRRRDC